MQSPAMRTSRQASAPQTEALGMASPAEPVKPVIQPRRASRWEMYSLWSRDGAVRGGRGQGEGPRGCRGLLPYHVGVRGGHDVGLDAPCPQDVPQPRQTRRCVGGRRGQVLVAQEEVLGSGGTLHRGGQEQGGGARQGSPVGWWNNPECHSWWEEPSPQHSLWARRHPAASACSLGPVGPLLQSGAAPGSCDPHPQPQTSASPARGLFARPNAFSPRTADENQRHSLV